MASSPWWAKMPYSPRVQFHKQLPSLEDIYTPLEQDQFRLLELQGFDKYGILRSSLQHARLEDKDTHAYTAISYTWNEAEKIWYGDYDTSPKPVRINGTALLVPDKVANILCIALQHGRSMVWIDSICINQSDLPEKSSQVGRMGGIYGYASEVLSYLGSPCGETDPFFDCVVSHPTLDKFSVPTILKHGSKVWGNDYWRRAWIFQELALARSITFVCGSRILPFHNIDGLVQALDNGISQSFLQLSDVEGKREKVRHIKNFFKVLYSFKSGVKLARRHGVAEITDPFDYVTRGVHRAFLDVLQASRRHTGCSDPRDMLYSRMAVATDTSALIPCVDYDMPVEDLYMRFAGNHIINTGSLVIITFARTTTMNLPTWVPDWTGEIFDWDKSNKIDSDGIGAPLSAAVSHLVWNDTGLPRISGCRKEVMVQGVVLKSLSEVESAQLEQFLRYSIMMKFLPFRSFQTVGNYKFSELPRTGDLICVLRGCPLLVYLRPVDQHFIMVGRHPWAREALEAPEWGVITKTTVEAEGKSRVEWTLPAVSEGQFLDEKIFRISTVREDVNDGTLAFGSKTEELRKASVA